MREEEKVTQLFCGMLALFEKFVVKVDEDIMQPFFNGDTELANENMSNISPNMTIDKLLSLVLKNFEGLVSLRLIISKHYGNDSGEEFLEAASEEFDAKMVEILQAVHDFRKDGEAMPDNSGNVDQLII